ncbi:MAG TPA: histidine triad nucleotide-binding protein [Candidatus Polarisedimenticolia bacterium]|nr:histidine triad nucleotide-binding protein [Candidatus Polarisedimenticolia bacterium]
MTLGSDCLFCRIIAGEINSKILAQDERVVAFEDINPQAPHHTLICPRKHISTLNDVEAGDEPLIGHMVRVAADLAREFGDAEEGYRLVANCQRGAGQSVFHIHFHLLGGRTFSWPPG